MWKNFLPPQWSRWESPQTKCDLHHLLNSICKKKRKGIKTVKKNNNEEMKDNVRETIITLVRWYRRYYYDSFQVDCPWWCVENKLVQRQQKTTINGQMFIFLNLSHSYGNITVPSICSDLSLQFLLQNGKLPYLLRKTCWRHVNVSINGRLKFMFWTKGAHTRL